MRTILLNTSILTAYGQYTYRPATLDNVMAHLSANGVAIESAIGDESTAAILSDLLQRSVPVNRAPAHQKPGETAVVFKLRGRAPEGAILSRDEVECIGYDLGFLQRRSFSGRIMMHAKVFRDNREFMRDFDPVGAFEESMTGRVAVAIEDENPVGALWYGAFGGACITSVKVHEDRRHLGIATKLAEAAAYDMSVGMAEIKNGSNGETAEGRGLMRSLGITPGAVRRAHFVLPW